MRKTYIFLFLGLMIPIIILSNVSISVSSTDGHHITEIERPAEGKIYFNDKELPFTSEGNKTIVIGPITVIVRGFFSKMIRKVEIKIDNNTIHSGSFGPVACRINKKLMGMHELKIVVHFRSPKIDPFILTRKIFFFNPTPQLFDIKGTIVGIVFEGNSSSYDARLEGINVTIIPVNRDTSGNNTPVTVTTGYMLLNRGKFRVRVKPGPYYIHIREVGYKPWEEMVIVCAGAKTRVKIHLESLAS